MYLHTGGAKRDPDKPDGHGTHTDTLNLCPDVHTVGNKMETAVNKMVNVSKWQMEVQMKISPNTPKSGMPKATV